MYINLEKEKLYRKTGYYLDDFSIARNLAFPNSDGIDIENINNRPGIYDNYNFYEAQIETISAAMVTLSQSFDASKSMYLQKKATLR